MELCRVLEYGLLYCSVFNPKLYEDYDSYVAAVIICQFYCNI